MDKTTSFSSESMFNQDCPDKEPILKGKYKKGLKESKPVSLNNLNFFLQYIHIV